MTDKFTLAQCKVQFPDDDACLASVLGRRYGKAKACPECGVVGKLTKIAGRRAYACKSEARLRSVAG